MFYAFVQAYTHQNGAAPSGTKMGWVSFLPTHPRWGGTALILCPKNRWGVVNVFPHPIRMFVHIIIKYLSALASVFLPRTRTLAALWRNGYSPNATIGSHIFQPLVLPIYKEARINLFLIVVVVSPCIWVFLTSELEVASSTSMIAQQIDRICDYQ
jgi:hypothetical protein